MKLNGKMSSIYSMCFISPILPSSSPIKANTSLSLANPPQIQQLEITHFLFNPNNKFQNMGLSPYSNPCDAGVLCVILVNTVMSISMMKQILRSILHLVGIRVTSSSSEEEYSGAAEPVECRSKTYMDEFRSRTPTLRYDSLSCNTKQECSVCLIDFKPDSEINRLSCGHVFHKSCVEKWLNYWNTTCPLCRNHMMMSPKETQENTCPM